MEPVERRGAAARDASLLWALVGAALLTALLVVAVGSRTSAAPERVQAVPQAAVLDGRAADMVARRVSAVHADVSAIWRHDFRWKLGRSYTPPEMVKFAGSRPSPCAGAAGVSGLAYCGIDRTLSVDLALIDALLGGPGGDGRALALLVARGSAGHVQRELAISGDAERRARDLGPEARGELDLKLALQGDCLTGVWARRAIRRLGEVPAGTWEALVARLREEAPAAAVAARLDRAEPAAREAAFGRGYEAGRVADCLEPGLEGVLG